MMTDFGDLLSRNRETKPNKEVSVIGSDLRIQGNLISRGEVHINGTIEGNVTATKIVVGKNGIVTGKLRNIAEGGLVGDKPANERRPVYEMATNRDGA